VDARTGIKPPETEAVSPMGLVAPPTGKAISLSPLNKRRWENFKANRRGYWSLWIFLTLFVVSLFAEFIANDKPIFVFVNGRPFFPAVITYPDTAFAKEHDPNLFGTAADFRDDYLMDLMDLRSATKWKPIGLAPMTAVATWWLA
jgi:microcin C transport system permease protein